MKDIIKPYNDQLFVLFGDTGVMKNATTLRLNNGITFYRQGDCLHARYHLVDNTNFLNGNQVIEQFESDHFAAHALRKLQTSLYRHVCLQRLYSLGKRIVKWIVAPLALVMFGLAFNMALTHPADGMTRGMPPMASLPANLGGSQQQTTQQPAISSAELAKAVADGAKSGKYTVQLSKGNKGTLYVFSDPSCPHCQEIEPELDKLAKDYSIYVFPVSVIGGEVSQQRIGKLLCSKPEIRQDLWKKVVAGNDLENTMCSEGVTAFKANDQFFRVAGFPGTPTMINAQGMQMPETISPTAQGIAQWMTTTHQ